MKKLLCICLALLLFAPVSVFAAEIGETDLGNGSTESEYVALEDEQQPEPEPQPELMEEAASSTMEIVLPDTGQLVLNPYGLLVNVGEGATTAQIVSETMTLTNNSSVPVTVSANAIGMIPRFSGTVFSTVPPYQDAREKEVFLYSEFQEEGGAWMGSYSGAENQILIAEGNSPTQEVLTLYAGETAEFRLFGETAVYTADPWSEDDVLSVRFVFSFAPKDGFVEETVPLMPEETLPEMLPTPPEWMFPELLGNEEIPDNGEQPNDNGTDGEERAANTNDGGTEPNQPDSDQLDGDQFDDQLDSDQLDGNQPFSGSNPDQSAEPSVENTCDESEALSSFADQTSPENTDG